MNFQQELRQLVQDAHIFIRNQIPHLPLKPQELPHSIATQESLKKIPTIPPIEEIMQKKVELPAPSPTKSAPSEPVKIKNSAWELQPMPAVCLMQPHKLHSFVPNCAPAIKVILVLPEENKEHRLFLENVSRAITRRFAPAMLALYDKSLFTQAKGEIFLIPLSLLKKKYPSFSAYQLLDRGTFSILALESLDNYLEDATLKRALWNAIQCLFQS